MKEKKMLSNININEAIIKKLIEYALNFLPSMLLPSGLFCYERIRGNPEPIGVSLRYSIIAAIGLTKAEKYGYFIPIDLSSLINIIFQQFSIDKNITIGDLGLLLWLDSELKGEHQQELIYKIEASLDTPGYRTGILTMELSWIVLGLAKSFNKKPDKQCENLLFKTIKMLMDTFSNNNLFYHVYGPSSFRKRFPNFAAQIYPIYTFSHLAKLNIFESNNYLSSIAKSCADNLISLQRPDGGWPWLYDAKKGLVVEPYEIYSVHQDGMAPMSFLQLFEITNNKIYLNATFDGLRWLYGNNELGISMIDENENLIYRSIRRKSPFDRIILWTNTAFSSLYGKSSFFEGKYLELNPTCRPYHLGWILEAWCGREHLINLLS